MRFECLSEEIAAAPVPMEVTPPQRMASACVGVLATSLVATPMDVVKTRVQAVQAEAVSQHTASSRQGVGAGYQEPCDLCRQQGRPYTTSARLPLSATAAIGYTASAGGGGGGGARPPPPLPSGTFSALRHIARWEGSRGLYQGLNISLIMAVPATVIYYSVYDEFLQKLEKTGMGNMTAPSTAGATARVIATVVMAPLELLRTRTQSQQAVVLEKVTGGSGAAATAAARGGRRRAWAAALADLPLVSIGNDLAKIFRQEGASALWRGMGTTMWRDVPFSMVYWLGYENLKAGLGCGRNRGEGGVGEGLGRGKGSAEDRSSTDFLLRSLVAGAMSGSVASLLTHPFDVVKTQRQVVIKAVDGGCEHRPPPPPRQSPGTFDVMRNIVESRGPAGLFTGALARVGKVAPACAIMMISYEAGKRFFGERNAAAAAAAAATSSSASGTRGQ